MSHSKAPKQLMRFLRRDEFPLADVAMLFEILKDWDMFLLTMRAMYYMLAIESKGKGQPRDDWKTYVWDSLPNTVALPEAVQEDIGAYLSALSNPPLDATAEKKIEGVYNRYTLYRDCIITELVTRGELPLQSHASAQNNYLF